MPDELFRELLTGGRSGIEEKISQDLKIAKEIL